MDDLVLVDVLETHEELQQPVEDKLLTQILFPVNSPFEVELKIPL